MNAESEIAEKFEKEMAGEAQRILEEASPHFFVFDQSHSHRFQLIDIEDFCSIGIAIIPFSSHQRNAIFFNLLCKFVSPNYP